MKVSLAGSARRDIDSAGAFYARVRRELVDQFIQELDRALSLIEENPRLGRRVGTQHRRFPLHGFPFFVNYRIDNAKALIRVVAISHQRRRPGYWANRVEELAPRYATLREAA